MGCKSAFFLLILAFVATRTHGRSRSHSDMPSQTAKIEELLQETIVLINNTAIEGETELAQVKAAANILHVYAQEAMYNFYKSVAFLEDPEFAKKFLETVKPGAAITYNVGKSINGDYEQLKSVLLVSLRNYKGIASSSKHIFGTKNKENQQFALNSLRETYDLGLFNSYILNVEYKYLKKPNQEIQSAISTTLESTHVLLKKVKTKNPKIYDELLAFTYQLIKFSNRIIQKIEQLDYLSQIQHDESPKLIDVSKKLDKIVVTLRERTTRKNTILDLANNLETFLIDSSAEITKLSAVDKSSKKLEVGIYRNVLLEYLILISTLHTKLQAIV